MQDQVQLKSSTSQPTLHYDYPPLMRENRIVGADNIGTAWRCKRRRVFHLYEKCRSVLVKEGGKLTLYLSLHEAWVFAQAAARCRWDANEKALVEMHLALNKAAALVRELELRRLRVTDLSRDELICYGDVMNEAVATAKKVLTNNGF